MLLVLSRHRHGKSLAALAIFGGALVLLGFSRPSLAILLVNPLELSLPLYLAFYVVKCIGLTFIDTIVDRWLRNSYANKPLPYRANTGAVGLEKLEWIDYLYLAINSVIEAAFSAHVIRLVLTSPGMAWRLRDFSMLNTLPALYLIFAIDDMFYAPAHKLMHAPSFYPYVHKHHHRQNLPVRGYLDAGNEHPVEQVIGLSCLWCALRIVSRSQRRFSHCGTHKYKHAARAGLTGVHAATILTHFVLYAILAVLNHTDYDVRFSFFGFEYSVGAHEMHHRYPQTNMAQYFMLWDKLMGTYKPYIEGKSSAKAN